jgi:DNA-binding NarL/FixJ family response regulator
MRICITDDHEVVREGLRNALAADPRTEIVGCAATAAEALRLARQTLPDVMLVDFRLPDMGGDELCAELRRGFPSTKVVILTTYLSEEIVQRSIDAGAAAFVTKAAGLDLLRETLTRLDEGEERIFDGGTSAAVRRLYEADPHNGGVRVLTPQQERVLELCAEGLTYGDIGQRLHISESTVRFHVQGLKDRLGVRTKTELIVVAMRQALIAPAPDGAGI